MSIRTKDSSNCFCFGDGKSYRSLYGVDLPIYISQNRYKLRVDIVKCNIPLLLSRDTLRRAKAKIDIEMSTICFLGNVIPLITSSSGHLCLSISRSLDATNEETRKVLSRVLFSSPIEGVGLDLKNKARKLHLQFCHPAAERLIDLVKKAGTSDQRVYDVIKEITSQCDVCIKNKKPPLKPAVSFPLASSFNEVVALDLKSRGSEGYILHMVDHLTRYSSACIIKNKRKETIVKGLMKYWIRIFGCPRYFLSDNGGEFVNSEIIDLAEKCNIILKTTAAESPWSNGLCERHNGILNDNINKIMASGVCSVETAVHWAVAAKNSLANVYGFSPNVLVFGRNPNFPNAFENKPPANNSTCLSDYVAENLNAMHIARKNFIEQEAAERLRRALNRKSRTYSNNTFCQGDLIYYWRNDDSECHGPAKVIGRDGQQILVKHGGMYIRVHPCRLQLCSQQNTSPCVSDKQSTENVVTSHRTPSSSDDDNDYATADDGDCSDEHIPTTANNVVETDNTTSLTTDEESDNWIRVNSSKDLPKINSTVECMFPNHDWKVKCKILSKAGKTSTGNWHYMNIKEDEEEGKCCSFKNASWKPLTDQNSVHEEEPTSNEVFYGLCDPVFDHAKLEEIEKWKTFKTFESVPDNGEKAITTRWVCTRKIKGDKVVYKARLVARGFEEDHKLLQTDSPTCAKESLRTLLTVISSNSWKLHSLDVKSAFLQGSPMERTVLIRPPKEANSKCLWKMLRCPYGLADAGRQWYKRLKDELLQIGMSSCKLDHAFFMFFNEGKLAGLLACHVDDIIFGGNQQFHKQVVDQLRSTFVIGLEEDTCLKYLGLTIKQDSYGISVSTEAYGKSLQEPFLKNVHTSTNKEFTDQETTALKKFCGQVNWLCTQGRPDISFDSCYLANSLKSNDSRIFHYANKLVRKVHNQQISLNFPSNFDLPSCSVVTFCDASFANLLNGGSQGGFLSFLVDKNGVFSPIAWQSRKIKRVVKSTIAAECLAAVEASEMTIYIATMLKDVLNRPGKIDTYLFCDSKNLVNAVHSSTNLEDKRLVIDVSVLRDMLEQQELTKFMWVTTEIQLADTLTKQGASDKLLINVFNDTRLRLDLKSGSFN